MENFLNHGKISGGRKLPWWLETSLIVENSLLVENFLILSLPKMKYRHIQDSHNHLLWRALEQKLMDFNHKPLLQRYLLVDWNL